MNFRHKLFAQEYVKDGNGAQAYRRAGYKVKTDHAATNAASRLLANVGIQAEIERLKEIVTKKAQITSVEVLMEDSYLSRSNIRNVLPPTAEEWLRNLPKEDLAGVVSLTIRTRTRGEGKEKVVTHDVRIRMRGKDGAQARLHKHFGLAKPDELTISGRLDVNHVTDAELAARTMAILARVQSGAAPSPGPGGAGTGPGPAAAVPG
jgi:phage terminase small subunit